MTSLQSAHPHLLFIWDLVLVGVITGCVDFWKPIWKRQSEQHSGDMEVIPAGQPVPECGRRALGHNHNGHMVAILRERSSSREATLKASESDSKVLLAEDGVHELDDLILQEKGEHSLRSSSVRQGDSHPSPLHWLSHSSSVPSVHMRGLSSH